MTNRLLVRSGAIALATGLTAAVAGVGVAEPPAAAAGTTAVPGVSTAKVSTRMLDLSIGAVLDVTVIGDTGVTNVDPASGTPSAKTALTPINLSSSSIPAITALNSALSAVTTPLVAQTPGGNSSVNSQTLNFSSPPGGVPLPVGLISGTVNAGALATGLDAANGATAKLSASLTQLNLVGGLLGANTLVDQDALQAAAGMADGTRTVDLGKITALDLGTLLSGLGVDLTKLPLGVVLGLVDKLGLPIQGLPAGQTSLTGAVNLLGGLLGLRGQAAGAQGSIPVQSTVASTVNGVLGLVGSAALPTGGTSNPVPVSTVLAVVGQLQTLLGGLLTQGLTGLATVPLIELDGGQLGVLTKAVPSVADSVAQVSGTLTQLKIAGQVLPGLDLGAAAAQIQAVLGQAQSALSSLLGGLSPNLANLVTLSMLDQSHQVTSSGGYTKAVAAITALTAAIDPSKIIGGIAGLLPALQGTAVPPAALGSGDPASLSGAAIGSLIGDTTGPLAALPNPIGSLVGSLNLPVATDFLTGPTVLKLGDVTSEAQAAPLAAPGAPGAPSAPKSLPRTGTESTGLAAVAAVLVALALGLGRLARRPVAAQSAIPATRR